MKSRALAGALCLAVVFVAGWRALQSPHYPPADELLTKALRAERNACYEADVTISARQNGDWKTVPARVQKKQRFSRLVYGPAAGGAVLIVGCGETTTCEPRQGLYTFCENCERVTCTKVHALLARNYRATIIGQEVAAGRDTWMLSLSPRNRSQGRSSRTLWVDKKTHLILRTMDYDCSRTPRSDFRITKLYLRRSLPDRLFRAPTVPGSVECVRLEKCTDLKQACAQTGYRVAAPQYVPRGFVLEGVRVCRCTRCECGFRTAQIRYTDGLKFISIYQQPKGTGCRKCGTISDVPLTRPCAVGKAGQDMVAIHVMDGCQVVAVADLPIREIRKVVESVR